MMRAPVWCLPALWLAACQTVAVVTAPTHPGPERRANSEAVVHMLAAKEAERRENHSVAAAEWEAATRADTASPTLQLGLARALQATGKRDAALAHAERSLRLDSTFAPAFRFLAEHYQEVGDYPAAARFMDKDVIATGDEEVGWKLVHLYRALRRDDDARRVLREMALNPRSTPDDLLQWARIADTMGLKASADEIYRILLRRWPASGEGVVAYGEYLDKRGRSAEAEALFRRALAEQPTSREVAQRLAWLLSGKEHWAEADSVMSRLRLTTAEDVAERKAWISLLLQRGQFALAVGHLERLLARHPGDKDFYVLLGQAHVVEGRYEQAAIWFAQAVQIDSSIEAFTGLIYAHLHAQEFADAEGVARTALGRYPGDTRVRYFLGTALRGEERWADAAATFGQLVQADTTKTDYLFDWASSLERAGRFDEAAAAFRRLLQYHPNDAAALNYLGYMYAERGVNLDEALRLITRALALDTGNGAYLDSMGWVLYRLGRYQEAKRYLQEAVRRDQTSAIILEHLGDAHRALDENDQARTSWTQALRLDPGNAGLQTKLRRLSARRSTAGMR